MNLADSQSFDMTNLEAERVRPWKHACVWLLFLGPFFFLSYGFANWRASQLDDVPSLVYSWEKHIPFIEWTIVPYMSIDLLYALSLFVCTTRRELDTHAKRLLAATVVSVACFLLFPLQFSFDRPPVGGVTGMLFDVLAGFDKPFNQAPSLHISLLLLLWTVYARHLRGMTIWLMHGWFFLIGISVLTTYQHHVIDVVGGIIVAILCLYFFPDHPAFPKNTSLTKRKRHWKLGLTYSSGALACGMIAFALKGWAWLLLWPATSLALVALAYLGFGSSIFQKDGTKARWPAQLLFAPYRIGAWISSRWLTRNFQAPVEIFSGIYIARMPGHSDWQRMNPGGVLDLAAEFIPAYESRSRRYRSVAMLDLVPPSVEQLSQAVHALNELHRHSSVLVHCALGLSRSALVVAAWLLHKGLVQTSAQAINFVQARHPQAVLPPHLVQVLEKYHHG